MEGSVARRWTGGVRPSPAHPRLGLADVGNRMGLAGWLCSSCLGCASRVRRSASSGAPTPRRLFGQHWHLEVRQKSHITGRAFSPNLRRTDSDDTNAVLPAVD